MNPDPIIALIVGFAVLFQVKHFFCDFVLQSAWMVDGKTADHDWFLPLAAHGAVHAVTTFVICAVALRFNNGTLVEALGLATFDWFSHIIADRLKSIVTAEVHERRFWLALGADQAWHHLSDLVIVSYIAMSGFVTTITLG